MDELEVEERKKEIMALQEKQNMFRLENSLLYEHLSRVVTSRKGSLKLHLEKLEQEYYEKEEPEEGKSGKTSSRPSTPISSNRSTVRFSAAAPPKPEVGMSTEEKCDIAEEECRYLQESLDKIRSENEHILDDLRAVLRQAKMSTAEVRKNKTDFARDVMLLASLNPANKPYSEDILGFIQEKLRRRQNLRDSIKVNNARLHEEIASLEKQFETKKDLKDILQPVDFDQLKILNNQLNYRTKAKLDGIHGFKSVMKYSNKALDGTRKDLVEAFDKGIWFKKRLTDLAPVIQSAKVNISAERKLKMKLYEALVITLQDQDGPPKPTAVEYMKTNNKVLKLKKQIRTWLGKVEVAELQNQVLEKNLALIQGITV